MKSIFKQVVYCFQHFTFQRLMYLLNGTFALLCYNVMRRKNRNIWVWGTGSGLYENNVKIFYEFFAAHNTGNDCYFITSNATQNIPMKTLRKGSIKAYLKAYCAQVLIFDSGYSDIAPGFIQCSRGLKVNLNHGQEGFKKLPSDYYKVIVADIHCAVSEFEKNIKIKECGAPASSVYVTGLARYDKVPVENNYARRDILLFFTWRDGLQHEQIEKIRNSTYYKKIEEVLTSEKIGDLLTIHNRRLYFRFHHMLPKLNVALKSDKIIQISEIDDFSKLINQCQILITDYSSMAWDYIYNGRDVIFYPFDYQEYSQKPGLYIDLTADSLMDVVFDKAGLETKLDEVLQRRGPDKNKLNLREKYFEFHDQNNCQRILTLIQKKIQNTSF